MPPRVKTSPSTSRRRPAAGELGGREPAPITRAGAISAEELGRQLAAQIIDGSRPVGSTLPREDELADQHGLSRGSVRSALRSLEELGLIMRARGMPPRVISGDVRATYVIPARRSDTGSSYLGATQLSVERQRRVVADGELALLLNAREETIWTHIFGLRFSPDPSLGPLACTEIWIAGDQPDVTASAEVTAVAIEEMTGLAVEELLETVAAATLTPAQARTLRARGGTPALHVLRRYVRRGGSTLAVVRDIHPADRVQVSVRVAQED